MKSKEIDTRQMINPVHHAEHFINKFKKTNFDYSTSISSSSLHLPSGLALKNKEIDYIINNLKSFFK
jgi:hypothetical protein